MVPALIFAVVACVLVLVLWQRYRRLARERFIRQFVMPRGLYERLRRRRPELQLKDCALVARGLRQFFLAYLNSGCRFVAMPSQGVDDLWHEFILYTRAYEVFCREAFGHFLHHTPAVVLSDDKRNNDGLRRVWWQCCREENIDPRNPVRLPLLFAIDAKLGIADGFFYQPDCKALQGRETGTAHCGADFADTSIDGGTDGFGDGAGMGGADGGADGGGCGGGCGGGD